LKGRYDGQLWKENRGKISNFKSTNTTRPDLMLGEFEKFMDDIATDKDQKLREYSAKLDEDHDNKMNRQTALSLGLARLSPAASFSLAISTLAGTSLSLKQTFQRQAEGYQQAFAKFMVAKTGVNVGGFRMRIISEGAAKPKPINPYELPAFEFHPPLLREQIASVAVEWGILLVGILAFFAGSFVAFLRYDVR
jgi:hypothetical protein